MPKHVLFDKEEVLKKVTTLFWRKGYNGTSMQDLVDVTGLNRSSLYNSFGDKSGLYMQSLQYYQATQSEQFKQKLTGQSSPKEALMAFFNNIKASILDNTTTPNGCFLTNCVAELEGQEVAVKDFVIANKEDMVRLFEQLIVQAQERGEIAPDKNAHHVALFLFSSLQGLRVTSRLVDDRVDIEAITEEILNSL